MKIFKEVKLQDKNTNIIICELIGKPFLEDEESDTAFGIKYYTGPIAEPKFITLYLSFEAEDKVYMSLAIDKNADVLPQLISELTQITAQLKITAVTKRLTGTDKYEFTSTPDKIKQLLPTLQGKLLKERYTSYKGELKPLSDLLVSFYQNIAFNIKKPSSSYKW